MLCTLLIGQKGRTTSMTASGDLLYIGTGGGVLLVLNCSTMEPLFVTHAYTGPIRSLLLVAPGQHSKMFSRLLSQNKPQIMPNQASQTSDGKLSPVSASAPQLKDPVLTERPERPALHLDLQLKAMEPLPAEQSVLVSFGLGYRGVVGDTENCPQEFILPSNISSYNRVKKAPTTKPAKPNVDDVHILLWSAGRYSKQIGSAKLESPQRRLKSPQRQLESPQRRANSSSQRLILTGKQISRDHI